MKRKLLVLVLTMVMVLAITATAYADANANWNAGKGTATVDGVKDDVYAGGQEMVMAAVSDGTEDGTSASAWAVYDSEAFYVIVEVKDSALDDGNANVYEKDSVEFRIESKGNLVQAYAVAENYDGTYASEVKVLKTADGYTTEFKVPYTTTEGGSVKFSLQVNACSDGKRNCTLHTNDDLKDVWQNDAVLENLIFSADAASTAVATADAPKTGVESFGAIFAMGAALSASGAYYMKKRSR
ncbi:MAG TPA: sugar-binding protein [Mobilitalea sp.]|nr:sugar-binding protein [Mobilitalea sp.]